MRRKTVIIAALALFPLNLLAKIRAYGVSRLEKGFIVSGTTLKNLIKSI